ncbi:hypothetical protein ASF33_10190 [Methylobacterium sp. Leaf92]|nr:hypothetical protein ASF33_10190 [Methylobacterium sp. Leaf92]
MSVVVKSNIQGELRSKAPLIQKVNGLGLTIYPSDDCTILNVGIPDIDQFILINDASYDFLYF